MNTYEITNITPKYNDIGLIELNFDITVINDQNKTFMLGWNCIDMQPLDGVDLPEEQLLYLAEQQCVLKGIYQHMDNRLMISSTPVYTGPAPVVPPPMTDLDKRQLWVTQIDNTIASIYNQFTRFQMEYEAREKAAQSYKDGGYIGEPSVWIKRFADNTNITFRQCTDLILSQAIKLRSAIVMLGQLRMDKYKILNAPTLEDAQIEFNTIINGAMSVARSL